MPPATVDRTIRLSCSDWSFPMVPHELSLDIIAALGFTGVDVMVRGNRGGSHIFPEDIVEDVAGWAGRLRERVASRGLELSDVFWVPWSDFETMSMNNPDPTDQERGRAIFADILEFAVRAGATGMTTLAGLDWPNESHEESLARAAEELGRRAALVRERGIRYSTEPAVGSVCASPEDALRLCELAPGLELTLDHTHFVGRGFTEAEVEPLIPHTGHLHVRGGADRHLQAPLAANTIDYERLVDELRRAGYEGFMTVEYLWVEWENLNNVDVLSETVLLRDRLREKLGPGALASPVRR